MSEVKWIKIVTDIFSNRKIKQIDAMPDSDAIIVIWFKILCLAGTINENGLITITKDIPYTDEMLATEFKKSINTVRMALQLFEKFGMIEVTNNIYCVTNWEKYQNADQLDRIREQTRKRVARYKDRKKLLEHGNVTLTLPVTHGNATDIELDKDIDKDKDKEIIIMSESEQRYISILESIKGYPIDRTTDLTYYKTLTARFPTVDLIGMIQDYAAYKLDNPLKTKDNPRSQINTQCKKCVEWGKNLKGGLNGRDQGYIGKDNGCMYDKSKLLYKGT